MSAVGFCLDYRVRMAPSDASASRCYRRTRRQGHCHRTRSRDHESKQALSIFPASQQDRWRERPLFVEVVIPQAARPSPSFTRVSSRPSISSKAGRDPYGEGGRRALVNEAATYLRSARRAAPARQSQPDGTGDRHRGAQRSRGTGACDPTPRDRRRRLSRASRIQRRVSRGPAKLPRARAPGGWSWLVFLRVIDNVRHLVDMGSAACSPQGGGGRGQCTSLSADNRHQSPDC